MSWWFNYAAVPSGTQTLLALTNSSANSGVEIGFHNGAFGVWRYAGMLLATTGPPSTGVWHHGVYTFDGVTHQLYLDGVVVSSSTLRIQGAPPIQLRFGGWSGSTGLPGVQLDDVRIYNRPLSAADIAELNRLP